MKYRIGYAVSDNLKNWERKDDLDIKHSKSGWDSEMVYFPSILKARGKFFLFILEIISVKQDLGLLS